MLLHVPESFQRGAQSTQGTDETAGNRHTTGSGGTRDHGIRHVIAGGTNPGALQNA